MLKLKVIDSTNMGRLTSSALRFRALMKKMFKENRNTHT